MLAACGLRSCVSVSALKFHDTTGMCDNPALGTLLSDRKMTPHGFPHPNFHVLVRALEMSTYLSGSEIKSLKNQPGGKKLLSENGSLSQERRKHCPLKTSFLRRPHPADTRSFPCLWKHRSTAKNSLRLSICSSPLERKHVSSN